MTRIEFTRAMNGRNPKTIRRVIADTKEHLYNSGQPETNELLCRELFKRGLVEKQMAREMKVSVKQVKDWLLRPGLPLSVYDRKRAAVELAKCGKSIEEIAKLFNVSNELIKYWLTSPTVRTPAKTKRLTAISLANLDYSRNWIAYLMDVGTKQVEKWVGN